MTQKEIVDLAKKIHAARKMKSEARLKERQYREEARTAARKEEALFPTDPEITWKVENEVAKMEAASQVE
jgi:hypothetical protein